MTILAAAFSFFILMDPIGNIPLFISLLKGFRPERQRKIIFRELLIALAIIFIFYFLGNYLLDALKLSQYSVLTAGGIILFLISLKMIFPSQQNHAGDVPKQREPFIVPLAVPLVAGPAILAAVMLYAHQDTSPWNTMIAITIAWVASTIILLASSFLQKILGKRGISACERLMGLLLTLIAVQMFFEGLTLYINK